MNGNTYTAEEVAGIIGCDAQTLRDQVKSDIAQGRNKQNFNAFQIGTKLLFSKNWTIKKAFGFDPDEKIKELKVALAEIIKWLNTLSSFGYGPELVFDEKIAEWLVAHGWAVNAEVQDGQD